MGTISIDQIKWNIVHMGVSFEIPGEPESLREQMKERKKGRKQIPGKQIGEFK